MTKRKWILTTSSVLLVLLLFAGYMPIAAEYGSQSDPLVSASYIADVLAPDTIKKVNDIVDQRADEFSKQMEQTLTAYEQRIDEMLTDFESKNTNLATNEAFINAVTTQVLASINGGGTSDGTGSTATSIGGWRMVEVEKGKTLVFEVGGMICLRIGSASCYTPSSPGLINLTSGSELEGGGALSQNNLYLVTVAGRGFTATGSTNKILIYGNYTIK